MKNIKNKLNSQEINKQIRLYKGVVKEILDNVDIPFVEIDTFWYKNGDKHKYKNKILTINCNEKEILISSYFNINNKTVRISNHDKKQGCDSNIILDIRYDNTLGKIKDRSEQLKKLQQLIKTECL